MSNQQIIDKIKKLLALGQSPNEHEAKLAMENANKLLTKYNLKTVDIEKQNSIHESTLHFGQKLPGWKSILIKAITTNNFCDVFINRHARNPHFVILGEKHNITIIHYMYQYLCQAIERWAKENAGKGIAAKNSYKLGMANGLAKRLKAIRQKAEQKGTENSTAIMIYDLHKKEQEKIKSYLNQHYTISSRKRTNKYSSSSDYQKGKEHSKHINLNKQID